MDIQRTILIVSMMAISFMLLIEWNHFQEQLVTPEKPPVVMAQNPANTAADAITVNTNSSNDVPVIPGSHGQEVVNAPTLVSIKTDTLHTVVDTRGGDIVSVALPMYPSSMKSRDVPFQLLNQADNHIYIAQSGLVGKNGTDSGSTRPVYSVGKNSYLLTENNNELVVDLVLPEANGVKITKRFTFRRGTYNIGVQYLVANQSGTDWSANFFAQIKRDDFKPPAGTGVGINPYLGAATTSTENHFIKMDFDDMAATDYKQSVEGGWIAMVQHYFISAWIPDPKQTHVYTTRHIKENNVYIMGLTSPEHIIKNGDRGSIDSIFYAGPKHMDALEALAPFLDLTVDYGWLWWIAKPLFYLMEFIHKLSGNWGLAIIGLTVFVKMLFLYPSTLSYRSMAAMKRIAPKMQELKEQYADTPQKFRDEMFKLYQKENANPMLGCLPMLIQMPVFIALYWTLLESVQLRMAPFIGWIHDLSDKDPYFLLPLLMGASMYLQQKLNPPAMDPTQQRVMQLMPVIFTGLFLFFPSGLVLYMLVNNIISMSHQAWIYRGQKTT